MNENQLIRHKSFLHQMKLNDKNAHAHYDYGRLQYELGKYFEAAMFFEMAIELDETIPFFYEGLGMAKYELEDYDSAIKNYLSALILDTKNLYYHYLIGKAKYKLNDYKGAIKYFEKAIGISIYINYDIAKSKEKLKDYDGARKYINNLIEEIGLDAFFRYEDERNHLNIK